jgi:cytochrome c5
MMMMRALRRISFGALLLTTMSMLSQTRNTNPPQTKDGQQAKSNAVSGPQKRDGQQVFDQNCSRCHTEPQGFSPRIAGTIARHMRVRAGLSKDDEQALLRFLNP